MDAKRVWSTAGVVALTGALLLTSAATASADYIRDKQWTLGVFASQAVWAQSEGRGITVAVVDTGVDGALPDLAGQVLTGKDYTEGGTDAQEDTDGHGTAMAAIIAGRGHGADSSSGVIGLAPKAKILPIRVSRTDSDLDSTTWGQGVRYAVDHGASVINLSFEDTGATPGSDGAKAIAYAQQHNVIVVAASGNEGADQIDDPAALPGVVSVGDVDESLKVVDYSNYAKGLTLTAPGTNIAAPSSTSVGQYSSLGGTSEAAAFVSAEAALVRAKFPQLTAGQVINRMIKSATFADNKVSKSPDDHYGYGIIRPLKALTMNIPAGPKQGPLAQPPAASKSAGAPGAQGSSPTADTAAAPSKDSSSNLPLIVVGVVAVLVIIVVVLVVVLRRRNRGGPGGPGGGTPVAGAGYPPYPGQTPQNGPAPYGQFGPPPSPYQPQPGNAPNPYRQQPPYPGQ